MNFSANVLEADASFFVTRTTEKHEPMETHLYYNIAMLSNCFKFAWSNWNATAGRRHIVLQIKEYCPAIDKVKKVYSTLHITPLRATFVDPAQIYPDFSETEAENTKFNADLYNLMKGTSGIAIRNKVLSAKKDTIFTLGQFLISVRLFSFS